MVVVVMMMATMMKILNRGWWWSEIDLWNREEVKPVRFKSRHLRFVIFGRNCQYLNVNVHIFWEPLSKHLKGQLGPPVNDEKVQKKWSLFQAMSWRSVGTPCEWQKIVTDNYHCLKLCNKISWETVLWSTIFNPSWALEAQSKRLRKPQNVPATPNPFPRIPY